MTQNSGQAYEAAFFDIDGTLVDSFEGIKKSVVHACGLAGKKIPSDSELRSFVGPPIEKSFRDYYKINSEDAARMADSFQEYYRETGYRYGKLYSGVFDLLKALEGMTKCVVTNKNAAYASKVLEYFEIRGYFSKVFSTDRVKGIGKGNIISAYLAENNIQGTNGIMIGDTIEDFQASVEAGCDFAGVTYGFGFLREVKYDFLTVGSMEELTGYLRSGRLAICSCG